MLITGNVPIATARSNATLGGILERRIFADRPPNLTSSQTPEFVPVMIALAPEYLKLKQHRIGRIN